MTNDSKRQKTEAGADRHCSKVKEEFLGVFDDLTSQILEDLPSDLPSFATEYINKCNKYNVPKGKLNRGLAVRDVLAHVRETTPSADLIRKADILGWCVEWLQAFFLVADDVMDGSLTRRGQPCWYKLEEVGMGKAVNDALLLETFLYMILKREFKKDSRYVQLLELFHETSFHTELGQLLDMSPQTYNEFTLDTYKKIVKYKTAYYTFYLPVALGMILGGVEDEATFKQAESICLKMGEYFQIQDDFLDCYGDPSVTGKIGKDIEERKCCWLVVQALARATAEQRKTIEEHYGIDDPKHVKIIKDLYKEMNIEQLFRDYENQSYDILKKEISAVKGVAPDVFTSLLHKIYKRDK